jgi:transcriptional regulator with XRE-family HTH domain
MPHPVDIHVGQKLRSKRVMIGMSQEELGQAVGVTFQQIQKYEKGLNRIGSSRLYEFSKILNVPVSYFFEDMAGENNLNDANGVAEPNGSFDHLKLDNKEILNLVRAYSLITDVEVRKKMLSLIKSLSTDNTPEVIDSEGQKN